MTVYLVRHGKARKGGKDRLRPLLPRGVREIRAMASFLRPLKLRAGAMWHSDRTRSIQTAHILSSAMTYKGKAVQRRDLGPDDSIASAIGGIKKARGDLIIVGHLPHLEKLASILL